jgi:hypothetical protein
LLGALRQALLTLDCTQFCGRQSAKVERCTEHASLDGSRLTGFQVFD